MKQSGRFTSLILIVVLLALACTSSPNPHKKYAKHIILIGVDGMSPDGMRKANTPIMDELMKNGTHSFTARAVLPSSSGANWASMLNGAGPEQHGVVSNSWRADNFVLPSTVVNDANKFPSVFRVMRDQMPDAVIGAIYQWTPIENFFEASAVDYSISPKDEDATTDTAVKYITEYKPDFTFIHLDHVDGAGHGAGHGTPTYHKAVEKADSLIGLIVQATKDAGIFDDTIIMVSADHGGIGKGHGGVTIEEVGIPWIVSGKGVKKDYTEEVPINTYDTPATILFAFGLEIPYEWIGRPVKSAFEGNPSPKLMYQLNTTAVKPVILPKADGNSPAGGLFIGKNAELQIQSANAEGEIHYTLDGSLPSPDSPVYKGPVIIDKTSVVKAQIFADGKAKSQIATGYFRILPDSKSHGIAYTTYQKDALESLPDFSKLPPMGHGTTLEIGLDGVKLPREEFVAVVYEGFIDIKTEGNYRFYLASDDGSKLYIDNKEVVDNDGDHGVIEKNGSTDLKAGRHPIKVTWFNGGGGGWLGAFYEGPGVPKQIIEPGILAVK